MGSSGCSALGIGWCFCGTLANDDEAWGSVGLGREKQLHLCENSADSVHPFEISIISRHLEPLLFVERC